MLITTTPHDQESRLKMTETNYSLTVKIAAAGSPYEPQGDKDNATASDITKSAAGHMWYSLSDGVNPPSSYGFQSAIGTPYGKGVVSSYDDAAYRETIKETTLALNESQYLAVLEFSKNSKAHGFDTDTYNALTNSCIDYTYAAIAAAGLNPEGEQGDVLPVFNDDNIKDLF